jgi:hypothetical protein
VNVECRQFAVAQILAPNSRPAPMGTHAPELARSCPSSPIGKIVAQTNSSDMSVRAIVMIQPMASKNRPLTSDPSNRRSLERQHHEDQDDRQQQAVHDREPSLSPASLCPIPHSRRRRRFVKDAFRRPCRMLTRRGVGLLMCNNRPVGGSK